MAEKAKNRKNPEMNAKSEVRAELTETEFQETDFIDAEFLTVDSVAVENSDVENGPEGPQV